MSSLPTVLQVLNSFSGASRRRHLRDYVFDVLGSIVDEGTEFDPDARFMDLSTDSLKAVELKQQLQDALGIKLRSTLLFDYPTPNQLCDHLYECITLAQDVHPADEANVLGPVVPKYSTEPIAVVGASCRFPGGVNCIESYWRLLDEGRDAIEALSATNLGPRERVASLLGQFPAFGGLIANVDEFDARLFGISAKEAVDIDPQQRVLLQVCWEALEDARIPPRQSGRRDVAVFVATRGSEYHEEVLDDGDVTYQGTGASVASLAGRVAHAFGFGGAAVTVDTACSGSLVALHYAASELRRGDCSTAIAAGVNLMISGFGSRAAHAAKMLAPDGRCKAFSASADGYVRSEGCAVLVLRRLSDAVADGDCVLGVIRGTAVNQDGTTSGLTVPSGIAQKEVIRSALRNAEVAADDISYVECHGTGTELGDPIEVQALSEALGAERRRVPLQVGSVKSQIGHTEPAAGLAGVMKVLLAMKHRRLPRTLHCAVKLNEHVDWKSLNVKPVTESSSWQPEDTVLFAGVSSFGFTGTNAHVILSSPEWTAEVRAPGTWPLLTVSAAEPAAVKELAVLWKSWLTSHSETECDRACRVSNSGRSQLPFRRAFSAASLGELAASIVPVEPASRAERQPTAIALIGTPETFESLWRTHGASWPALASAYQLRTKAIEVLTGGVLTNGENAPRAAELRGLAAACAVGDALLALGLEPERWVGDGIGAFAASVLAGTPLERVVAATGFAGSIQTSDVLNLSPETAQRLAGMGIECVVAAGAGTRELIPGAVWLSDAASTLTVLCKELFERGHTILWESVRSSPQGRLENLPSHPFRKSSFWRSSARTGQTRELRSEGGSWLREWLSPALSNGERVFLVGLDPRVSPWLGDHVVETMPVLPASGVLELLRQAGRVLLGHERVCLEDVRLERAVLVTERGDNLQLVTRMSQAGDYLAELSAARPEAPGRFVRHASARIVEPAALTPTASLSGVPGKEVSVDTVYSLLERAGVRHGTKFRALQRLSIGGDVADLDAVVASNDENAWGTIGVDACFLASAALLDARGDMTPRLPSGCERVVFFRAPPQAVRSTVRLRPTTSPDAAMVDVEIVDQHNRLVAAIEGLGLAARETSAVEDPNSLRALSFEWVERELALDAQMGVAQFHLVSDDQQLAARLQSVLRSVHKLDALTYDVGVTRTIDLPMGRDRVHHVVLSNYRTGGPEFLATLLPLLRSLVAVQDATVRLWVVTSGVFSTDIRSPRAFEALSRGAVWGFIRAFQHEAPSLSCTLLDIDAAITVEAACELLPSEFRRNRDDAEVRYVDGTRQIPAISNRAAFASHTSAPLELKRDGT